MTLDIPFNIGEEIIVDGNKKTIKGMHLYVNKNGEVSNIRLHFGGTDKNGNTFTTFKRGDW